MCKIKINKIASIVILHILVFITRVSANNDFCYSSGGVFGIIISSVIITLVVIGLALATLWFLWTKNRLKLDFILNKSKKSKTDVDKKGDLESANHDYAFDNPYFQEDDTTGQIKTQKETIILLEGKEIPKENTNEEMNDAKVSQDKQRNGQMMNNRFVKSLPLSTVFNHVPILNKKHKQENQKSMDDSFIRAKPEKLEVELIGHDFTGLGFNICGNMKDGIFIKDVQNKGPANESGKVKAGDRIISVNVSYEKMVYEDAVAILSYASPYNVRIELEKSAHYSTIDRLSNNLIINKNVSMNTNKQLLHPLYRSHSVDDLTRIGKELSLSEKSTSSAGKNVVQKIKSQIFNRTNNAAKQVLQSDENLSKSLNIKDENEKPKIFQVSAVQLVEAQEKQKSQPEIETNVTAVTVSDQTDSNGTQYEEVVQNIDYKVPESSDDDPMKHVPDNQVVKKPVTPAKRKGKAPMPPIAPLPQIISLQSQSIQENQSNGETIETTAQVHNEEIQALHSEDKSKDETDNTKIENQIKMDVELNGHLSSSSESNISEEHNKSEDLNSVPLQSNSPQRVQSPTGGKPKSSSMSDLTYNNNRDKLQSALLERAVSLDMNAQNLPEENLYQHPKNLLVPDDQNADSMPIISWYINKQSNTDTNSSESTLNEFNQAFIIDNQMPQTLESFKTIDLSNYSNENISENQNQAKVIDDTNFISHIDVEPNTSTPLKMNKNSAIDQYIHLDSSFSSSDSESADHTLVEKSGPTMHSVYFDSKSENSIKANDSEEKNKEVIELSQSELDDVMMSHKAFLIKQAKIKGSYPNITVPLKPSLMDSHLESLEFESWHFEDPQNKSDSTLYTTALDISDSNDSELSLKPKKLPEVAGITLKTGENGQLTNTVIISTNNDLSNSSFSSTSSTTPSN